jgi:hypothetical protein
MDEIREHTQRHADVLDLAENRLASRNLDEVLSAGPSVPLELFFSSDAELGRALGLKEAPKLLTFEGLFNGTGFLSELREIMQVLEKAYDNPVDVEFTLNFLDDGTSRINLLQCRPFQAKRDTPLISIPEKINPKRLILETAGPVVGTSRILSIDTIVYVRHAAYAKLPKSQRYLLAKLIGRITHRVKENGAKAIMLIGPGRWGTSVPALGVPVSFADMNAVSVVCEIAAMHEGLVPEVSLGTHFFNDLVELDMVYLAVFPDRKGYFLNEKVLDGAANQLSSLFPEETEFAPALSVIDTRGMGEGRAVYLSVNTREQKGLLYLG